MKLTEMNHRKREENSFICVIWNNRGNKREKMTKERIVTREVLIETAFEIIQMKGFQFLSIYNIMEYANCSSQQIYEVYEDVEELKQDVIIQLTFYFDKKINSSHLINKTDCSFFDYAMSFICTAYIEPKLFKLLYIDNISNQTFTDTSSFQKMSELIKNDKLTTGTSHGIFCNQAEKLWVYTYELAFLCATGMMVYDERKIEKILNDFVHSFETNGTILANTHI